MRQYMLNYYPGTVVSIFATDFRLRAAAPPGPSAPSAYSPPDCTIGGTTASKLSSSTTTLRLASVSRESICAATAAASAARRPGSRVLRVLLIEDSRHDQNLITLLMRQQFAHVELSVADDGIAGLAMAGQLQPDVLLVDIPLPGIDGTTLIGSLRSHPTFACSQLIVITSLDESALEPYALVLGGVPRLHKARLVAELPALLTAALQAAVGNASAFSRPLDADS